MGHVVKEAIHHDPIKIRKAVSQCIQRDNTFLPKVVKKSDAVSLLEKLAAISPRDQEFQTWLNSEMNKHMGEIQRTKDRKANREADKQQRRERRNFSCFNDHRSFQDV